MGDTSIGCLEQPEGSSVASTYRMYQIGEVADQTGLSLRTVRYYEEVGLAVPSERTEGGFRLYTDADVERLEFIKRLKPLDFTLEELRDLLHIRDALSDPTTAESDRAQLAERLNSYVTTAKGRCNKLRQRLEQAEAETSALATEARRAKRARAGRS